MLVAQSMIPSSLISFYETLYMNHYKLDPEENTFETIMVDITHRCNMSCFNCYLPNRTIPDMSYDKLLDFIDKLPNRTFIRLIGAEPTLRDDLPSVISEVKKRGHRVSLTTNGLKLSKKSYVEKLRASGLRLVLLSMNGADDDSLYAKIDNMKCAEKKVAALRNCIDFGMIINTGTILSKGINESVIHKQVNLFYGMKFKVKPVLRFRTIGLIGRNQGKHFVFKNEEFLEVIKKELSIDNEYIYRNQVKIINNTSGIAFKYRNVIIRLVDWTINNHGVPDAGNKRRGRITKDWKIAPFFEDIKLNEFGY